MAFVNRSERVLGGTEKIKNEQVGPGSYLSQDFVANAKKKMSV